MKWVDATDLKQWADRRDCQATLPELIRRLVRASAEGISFSHFPSGESVQSGGWDGILFCEQGNEYVPKGLSVWEFGCNKKITSKAESDFNKRTKNPNGIDITDATYVFVTPRAFAKGRSWANANKQNSSWKDVKAYNADDLEGWLEQCHAVDLWLSRLLVKSPGTVVDAKNAWEIWSCCIKSPNGKINPVLPIAGREVELNKVHEWLLNKPSILNIKGNTREEAYAFVLAAIQLLPTNDKEKILSRTVVVEKIEEFRLLRYERPLIFICHSFDNTEICHAVEAGHHVVLFHDKTSDLDMELILSRPQRQQFIEALKESGIEEQDARKIAKEADFDINNLHKIWSNANILLQMAQDDLRLLAPLRLINKWDHRNPVDQSAISKIFGKPYAEAESLLRSHIMSSEKIIDFADNKWRFSSSNNVWQTFQIYFTTSQIKIFREIALEVFTEITPELEIPPEERYMASVYGKKRKYSNLIREGLAETLIFISLSEKIPTIDNPQGWIDCIVYDIFEKQSFGLWYSLQGMMRYLAEASPSQFLSAVESGLNQEPSVFIDLFQKVESPMGTPGGYYTDLLWALEGIARNPDYLLRATMILARLTYLHQPSNLCNSPGRSLGSIFCFWMPQTAANFTKRQTVIEKLVEKYPDVAWNLLLSLIPSGHDIQSPTHKFEWRNEFNLSGSTVTNIEYYNGVKQALIKIIGLLNNDGIMWQDFLDKYCRFGITEDRQLILNHLQQSLKSIDKGRYELWNKIREVIYQHEKYSKNEWPNEELNCLKEIYIELEPEDFILKNKWLFDDGNPDIIDAIDEDFETEMKNVNEIKKQAVKEIIDSMGLKSVFELSQAVKMPGFLGHILAELSLESNQEQAIIDLLISDENNLINMASSFIFMKFYQEESWWKNSLAYLQAKTSKPIHIARFLISLPGSMPVWEYIEKLSFETRKEYWTKVTARIYTQTSDELEFFVQKLNEFGRYYSAIDIAALYDKLISVKTVIEILKNAVLADEPASEKNFFNRYNIKKLFKAIYNMHPKDKTTVAHLEWAYLEILCDYNKDIQPQYLSAELATDSNFFIEILCWIYKGRDEETPQKVDESSQRRATLAYKLLNNWSTMPGQRPDGSIDISQALTWLSKAETACRKCDRYEVGFHHIGNMFARKCKFWKEKKSVGEKVVEIDIPYEICEIIEQLENSEIERGFSMGINNSRGVFWRSGKGGEQEREIAKIFNGYALSISSKYPRVARLMESIAHNYTADAKREDSRAEWREIDGD